MTHLHWRDQRTCEELMKVVAFHPLHEFWRKTALADDSGEVEATPITEIALYLVPLGDRLHKGGLITSSDQFGGRVIRAGYFPAITKEELQVLLSSVKESSSEWIEVLEEPIEHELKVGSSTMKSPLVMRTRLSFSSPDYLYEFVHRAMKSVLVVSDRFVFAMGIPDEAFVIDEGVVGTADMVGDQLTTAVPIFADVQSHAKIIEYLCQALPTETYGDTEALKNWSGRMQCLSQGVSSPG